jgi:hypothetical protein
MKEEYIGVCKTFEHRKFSDDIKGEDGKWPDHRVILDGLDDTAMKAFWADFSHNSESRWCAIGTNCSAVVAAALRAGGSDKYEIAISPSPVPISPSPVPGAPGADLWTPASVLDYALRLQKKLREAGKLP